MLTSACDGSGVDAGAGGALLPCDVEVEFVEAGTAGALFACDAEVELVEVLSCESRCKAHRFNNVEFQLVSHFFGD